MENKDTLATELLHELKKSNRRNFILAIILLIALVVSNVAWLNDSDAGEGKLYNYKMYVID